MNPKEKAKELVEKYMYELMIIANVRARFPLAKACALIAVDEILELDVWFNPHASDTGYTYWQQVKTEIANL